MYPRYHEVYAAAARAKQTNWPADTNWQSLRWHWVQLLQLQWLAEVCGPMASTLSLDWMPLHPLLPVLVLWLTRRAMESKHLVLVGGRYTIQVALAASC